MPDLKLTISPELGTDAEVSAYVQGVRDGMKQVADRAREVAKHYRGLETRHRFEGQLNEVGAVTLEVFAQSVEAAERSTGLAGVVGKG